jgi:predicted transcriptional regulator
MPEVRRVVLDIKIYDALKAEALVRHENLKDTLSAMVLENLSSEAQEVLKCLRDRNSPKTSKSNHPCGTSLDVEKSKQLSKNPDALNQIKTFWNEGERNRAEIARKIGYPKATTSATISRMIKAGELRNEID